MQKGDYLLIIAGDRLDSRAVKLSQAVLAAHLVRPWVLALVEVAVFEEESGSGNKTHLLVPHIRGTILPERRQVVTIEIQGDRTRVDIGPATPVATGWDEERFFAKAEGVEQTLRQFAEELRQLREEHSDVSLVFGHGKAASVTLHKGRDGILTFQIDGSGSLSFNPPAFPRALGQEQGSYYLEKLQSLFPHGVKENWATVKLNQRTAERELRAILALLREVLTNAPIQAHSEVAASS